jgi:hypothetical protein
MFNGLDKYHLRGRTVASREIASTNPAGAVMSGREVARGSREVARSRETASSNTSASAMALGGITDEDLSLAYVGGSSSSQGGGKNNSSNVPAEIYKYYAAIFREDSICGAAIELRANIPYGDFSIQGVEKSRAQKFEEAVENMRLRTMMPRLAIERDVQGAFLGMLDWNSEKKTYDSLLPYSRQHVAKIIYSVVHGMDPVVDINLDAFLTDIVKSQDARLKDIKSCIPKFILNAASSGGSAVPVPMDSVVWIDRPHTDPRFNSILHRILPVFLIERALTRGTIEAAHRRQRGILHIVAGLGDQWLATPEEMTMIAQLFNNADADPLGAIVVTREGINASEVRNPTDFWRITDSYEQTVPFKLRAMGVSESFLSGDATFNNAEVAISTFLQTIKTERAQVTDQLLYRKIFAQIAAAHDFKIKGMGRERGSFDDMTAEQIDLFVREETAANSANALGNLSAYDIPKIAWKQSLMPEGDQAYIEMLALLEEKNVPAPIRAMFAAGGLDFDAVMDNKKQDLDDRKKLSEYIENIRDIMPKPVMEGEGGPGDEFAMFGGTREVGVLNRDYANDPQTEYAEPYTEFGGKKRRPITAQGRSMLREKQRKELAHALARVAEIHNRKVKAGVE